MAEELAKHEEPLEIVLFGDNKAEHEEKWKTYREKQSILEKHRGQTFSMILGQCLQHLLDQMKQDVIWTAVATSYDPLQLISSIEKTVLSQTEDQYPFTIVYVQYLSLYGFHQNTMTTDQWYERFNTKVDVGTSIGVTRQNSVLLEWTSQSVHSASFQDITNDKRTEIQTNAEERYLAYIFLKQIAKTSEKLRTNLSDDYTTGEN